MADMKTSKKLSDYFNPWVIDSLFTEAAKHMSNESPFEIDNFEYSVGDKKYLIKPKRIDHEEIIKKGNSSCNYCWGKGYYISHLSKFKYPDPANFMVIKPEHLMPNGLIEEQQKMWIEREQKIYDESQTWCVMNICKCAVKRMAKLNPNMLNNQAHTLFIEFDFEEIESDKTSIEEETNS
jgi:hypothetical protein